MPTPNLPSASIKEAFMHDAGEPLKVPPEIAAIRDALAAGPTPGSWMHLMARSGNSFLVHDAEKRLVCSMSWHHSSREHYTLKDESAANAALIAAANPAAMTAVLAHYEASIRAKDAEIAALKADAGRTARNRDMWKGQCERQVERLTKLHISISDHNKDCARQCNQRKEMGAAHCPMKGYDRDCGDCPRDGMLTLANDGSAIEPWMEQEAKYDAEMREVSAAIDAIKGDANGN